jgi:hypothetical protein
MEKTLKNSSDYPQLNFRIPSPKKEAIDLLLERVMSNALKDWKEGERKPKRNEFLAEALELGLKQLLKKKRAK